MIQWNDLNNEIMNKCKALAVKAGMMHGIVQGVGHG